jgi:drug/metabolite transporter (DMT)-like permease
LVVAIGVLFAIATMLCWGASDFFAKKAVDKVGYVTGLVVNQVVTLGPVFILAAFSFQLPAFSIDLILLMIVTGFFALMGFFYLYKGLKKGNLSVVSPISASWFIITTVVAAVVFSETLTPLRIFAVAVVFIGVFFTSTNLKEFVRSIEYGKSNGVLEALLAMISWGFSFALIKPVVDASSPLMALLFIRLIANAFLFVGLKITRTKISFPSRALLIILIIAGLLDAFGFATYNSGIASEYVSIVSPMAAAYPAATVLLGRFLLKERLVQNQKLGVLIILVGLIILATA